MRGLRRAVSLDRIFRLNGVVMTICAVLGAFIFCPSPARAWDPAAADKLKLGETTAEESEALLGRPDNIRHLLFRGEVERRNYLSWTRVGLPAQSLALDFVGGRLVHAQRLPDAVEERSGFVLEAGFGAASAKTTGSRRLSAGEKAVSIGVGWAPHERLAVLFDILGALGTNSGQTGGGLGVRFFPVMPWYVQGSYMVTTDSVQAPVKNYTLEGRGYAVRTGYEFGLWRKGAMAVEAFGMKTHSWAPDKDAPIGTVGDLRSTVWGALLKFVWYP